MVPRNSRTAQSDGTCRAGQNKTLKSFILADQSIFSTAAAREKLRFWLGQGPQLTLNPITIATLSV
jgi:hypothetical protein